MTQDLRSSFGPSAADVERDIEIHPLFSRPWIIMAYIAAGLIAVLLIVSAATHSTTLVQPIDPGFHAAMIGLGVFVGVLLAAIVIIGRTLGIGTGGQSPFQQLTAAIFIPLLIVGLCGFAGSYVAERMVEWRAFHDLTPEIVDSDFDVIGKLHGKSSYGLKLRPAGTDYSFSISCNGGVYSAVASGDRLILPVEIGRGGIGRTQLPATATELHRA
jgi:hypothetical protein